MISFMDHQVGRVLEALKESGQAGNTRIIYTSDHGEMLGSYGLWGKSCMYDDSVGVPFIVAGPDIPAGRVSDQNVSIVDCFPSVLDCVGVPLEEEDADLPGTSLWPIATGESKPDRIAFSEYHALFSTVGNYMVKDDRYKLIYYAGNGENPVFTFRLGRIGLACTGIYSLDRSIFRFVAPTATERDLIRVPGAVSLDARGDPVATF